MSRSPRTMNRGGKAASSTRRCSTGRASRSMPASGGVSAHPNSRFTVSAQQQSYLLAAQRGPDGRADLRARVRRPAPRSCAARVRGAQLAARRIGRRLGGVRDHGGGDRRGRRRASRSDGDETLRRLQLRRLLAPLARASESASSIRPGCSTSTGSGAMPPASSCGPVSATTCASSNGFSSAVPARSVRRSPPSAIYRDPEDLNLAGADVNAATIGNCSR